MKAALLLRSEAWNKLWQRHQQDQDELDEAIKRVRKAAKERAKERTALTPHELSRAIQGLKERRRARSRPVDSTHVASIVTRSSARLN